MPANVSCSLAVCLSRSLELPSDAVAEAGDKDFELCGYGFTAEAEEVRPARIVRVAVIQNKIVLPTTAPILDQVDLYTVNSRYLELGFLEFCVVRSVYVN